jgi:alpha-ketoglutarate-dependent taurine dioxygenase
LKIDTIPPSGGGDTMFADGYAAYDKLTPKMQAIVGKVSSSSRHVFFELDSNNAITFDLL